MENISEVKAIYLFGSRATGRAAPISAHMRNPIAQAQNKGISECSLELSDLWLQELDRRYPDL